MADRDETLRRVTSMTADLQAIATATAGSNVDDEHDPEGNTIAFERAQLVASLTRTRNHLADIDAALGRLSSCEYERCQQCRGPIAPERLAALPTTRTCITCASG